MNGAAWSVVVLWLAVANATGFLSMAADKRYAMTGARRIPERFLFGVAAVGGGPGVLLAMRVVRHKTKHASFQIGVPLLTILSYGLAAWLLFR